MNDGPRIIPRPIEDGHMTATREIAGLVRELDRMLAPHDCGNTAGYSMWRDRMAGALDVHELELAGRHIIEPGGPVIAT
jgi:hypothetical protein